MKAILFDWSETLVSESSKNNLKPFCDSFIRSCKIKPLSSDVEKVLNRVFLKITENLKNKKLTVPFRLIYKIIADILGTESAYSIEEAEYDCYTSTYNITAKNNSYAVLSALQNKNLDIGIITNNRFSSKTISSSASFNDNATVLC